jgi:hypothetical protein
MAVERNTKDRSDTANSGVNRKPWRTPRLTEYGPVAKLTQSGLGSIGDGGMGAMMSQMVCL